MSRVLSLPAFAPGSLAAVLAELRPVPADLVIPPPPRGRLRNRPRQRLQPSWKDAMRWSLIGLTVSWAAGEATLVLLGI